MDYRKTLADRKAGRLKQGQTNQNVDRFMSFHLTLAAYEETISEIFAAIAKSESMVAKAQSNRKLLRGPNTGKPPFDPKWNDLQIAFEIVKTENIIESHNEIINSFSGTLFILLNSVLEALGKDLRKLNPRTKQTVTPIPGKKKKRNQLDNFYSTGRKVGKVKLFRLIKSASNNFRHFEDWSQPSPLAKKNIRVLKDAGLRGPTWNANRCGEVFKLLNYQDTDELIAEMKAMGSELLKKVAKLDL